MAKKTKVVKGMEKASKRTVNQSPARGTATAAKRTSKVGSRKGSASSLMIRGMEQASKKPRKKGGSIAPPKKGDQFKCEVCGMAIAVTADCHSENVSFSCCGQELTRV